MRAHGSFQTINERSNEDVAGALLTSGRDVAKASQGTGANSQMHEKMHSSKSHDFLVATQIGD